MIKNFAKWFFIKTHQTDIDTIAWWANYHLDLSKDKKYDDYNHGVYNGIHNAFLCLFQMKVKNEK